MTCTRAPGTSRAKRCAPGDGRERVVLAPQGEERHAERGELALVGLELGELAAAVELELAAAARLVGERLEVLAGVLRTDPLRDRAEHAGERLQRHPVDELLALARRAQRVGHPVPAPVREEAGVAGDHRPHRVGVVAGPAQADQPAPVVADQRHALEPLGLPQRLERLDVPRPRPRRVWRGVAEARQVGRDGVQAVRGERLAARAATCARTPDSRGRAARRDPRGRRRS